MSALSFLASASVVFSLARSFLMVSACFPFCLASASPSSLRSYTRKISSKYNKAELCFSLLIKKVRINFVTCIKNVRIENCHGSLILGHSVVDQEIQIRNRLDSEFFDSATEPDPVPDPDPTKKWNDKSSHRQLHTIFQVKNKKTKIIFRAAMLLRKLNRQDFVHNFLLKNSAKYGLDPDTVGLDPDPDLGPETGPKLLKSKIWNRK